MTDDLLHNLSSGNTCHIDAGIWMMDAATRIEALQAELDEARAVIASIDALGGNMPDQHWIRNGGPKDAEMRGGLFVSAKEIARAFLSRPKP